MLTKGAENIIQTKRKVSTRGVLTLNQIYEKSIYPFTAYDLFEALLLHYK